MKGQATNLTPFLLLHLLKLSNRNTFPAGKEINILNPVPPHLILPPPKIFTGRFYRYLLRAVSGALESFIVIKLAQRGIKIRFISFRNGLSLKSFQSILIKSCSRCSPVISARDFVLLLTEFASAIKSFYGTKLQTELYPAHAFLSTSRKISYSTRRRSMSCLSAYDIGE